MRYLIDIIDTSNEPNIINQILDKQKTRKMKKYIVTFQKKCCSFNANNIEEVWTSGTNIKDAEKKARSLSRLEGRRFVSIRAVK